MRIRLPISVTDRWQITNIPADTQILKGRTTWPAILNTENSFDLKTIEGDQMAMKGLHGFKNKDIEKVSYRSPEFNLRA